MKMKSAYTNPELKTARKEQRCCHCRKPIPAKSDYMAFSGYWHKTRGFIPDKFHLDCWASKNEEVDEEGGE